MTLIVDNADLAAFCRRQVKAAYITVDTEFIRDTTYWPKLCLVQIGGPEEVAAIDPLAPDLDLAPLFELMAKKAILKVFHSARQDMEIFFLLMDKLPAPIFDTQVAAMVCGFGDSVGYDTLVRTITGIQIDKSSRFTDWARRPLKARQLDYALSDVSHLRRVYEKLRKDLQGNGRGAWLDQEMAILTNPDIYRLDPETAWRRLKTRSSDRRYLAVLQSLAAWRETEAQRRNVPRNRVLRDEQMFEIAAHRPRSAKDLGHTRGFGREVARGRLGAAILAAVAAGLAVPDSACPEPPPRTQGRPGPVPVVNLLKVLLKVKCEAHGVAQKLVASSADLERIAGDDAAPVPALTGWRREIFGEDALAVKSGRLALGLDGGKIVLVPHGGQRRKGRKARAEALEQ